MTYIKYCFQTKKDQKPVAYSPNSKDLGTINIKYLKLNLIDKIKINCADDRFELPLLDHESNMLPLHQPAYNI